MQVTRPCQPFGHCCAGILIYRFKFLSARHISFSLSRLLSPSLLAAQSLLFLIFKVPFKYRFFPVLPASASSFRSSYFDRLLFGSRSFSLFRRLGAGGRTRFMLFSVFCFFFWPPTTNVVNSHVSVRLAHTHSHTHAHTFVHART